MKLSGLKVLDLSMFLPGPILTMMLADHGAGLADVVKTLVFVTDMGTFAAVNEAYVSCFGDHRPARSVVGVAALPMGAAVEVEVWAYRPG